MSQWNLGGKLSIFDSNNVPIVLSKVIDVSGTLVFYDSSFALKIGGNYSLSLISLISTYQIGVA